MTLVADLSSAPVIVICRVLFEYRSEDDLLLFHSVDVCLNSYKCFIFLVECLPCYGLILVCCTRLVYIVTY